MPLPMALNSTYILDGTFAQALLTEVQYSSHQATI